MLKFQFIYGENGYKIVKDLRNRIFKDELGYDEVTDDLENESYHIVGYEEIHQMGLGRMTEVDSETFEVSFVGLLKEYRRQYVGDLVMRALADKAERLGAKWMIVKAPVALKGFFEFESYEVCGDAFMKNNEPHILMKKDLTKKQPCRGCSK
ncbi:MAG: GNAT family N-acetyltransferase [Clostridia bacterium]|nr:GNAT family N-acetyltransferase [Clostridia bacterium]